MSMENNESDILMSEIKEIIFSCAKKGGMCEDFIDGQILGLRTGEGLEFEAVTIKLAEWHIDKTLKNLNLLKSKITK